MYVTNYDDASISVIATASSTVLTTVPVQDRPLGVAITPDGAVAYVTNQESSSVSVIDIETNTVSATTWPALRPWPFWC